MHKIYMPRINKIRYLYFFKGVDFKAEEIDSVEEIRHGHVNFQEFVYVCVKQKRV